MKRTVKGTVTRTVAFTDLANYTAAVSRANREELRRLLADHEALVAPIAERHGGRVVKNLGDSFMVIFDAATDALRAALQIQEMVRDSEISIRVALETGDVEAIEGDAFGYAVNLAARILAKAPPQEIWFGPATRICMNASEIPWESVGRFRFKGIPGEREIFRAVPPHQCKLPEPVARSVKQGRLVRFVRGEPAPLLPPDPVVLLEGYPPGSPALSEAVDKLPVINPASLWLAAYNIATDDRVAWREAGRGLVIGTPEAIDQAVADALKVVTRHSGSDTIVLDVGVKADVELVMCGIALPAVPLHEVVSSYFYDLLSDGRWVNQSDHALLRVEVTPEGPRLHAMTPGILINGRAVDENGPPVDLDDGDQIATAVGQFRYETSTHTYVGLLIADTEMRLGVVSGTTAELGREPRHPGLAYPDRRGQDNIRWCPGQRAARARSNGFTLDRALAGRRQAAIQVNDDQVQLKPLHPRCATYLQRFGNANLELADRVLDIRLGDRIVAGTTVVALRAPETAAAE
ncbi:MAG: adenylate/guanylate cyclase domain-containing protein [Myxococcota bacterium]